MSTLSVALVQTNLFWEDKAKNLSNLSRTLKALKTEVNLIVLPEMFTTGFTMKAKDLGEGLNGETLDWMRGQSKLKKAAIIGSYIVKEGDCFFNRSVFVHPDGSYDYYDKRHLFSMASENKYFKAGNNRVLIDYCGWKICPLICYDLRFPVFSRNYNDPQKKYDLLIYMANWPMARQTAWDILLQARAHENQSYVIGVNRIGKDGNEICYNGGSAIIDPKGSVIKTSIKEEIIVTQISKEPLIKYRNKFPAYKDADRFKLE